MAQAASLSEQYSRFKQVVSYFPYKCRIFLSLLISLHDEHSASQVPKAIRKNYEPFTAAFKRLPLSDRVRLLSKAIAYAAARINATVPPSDGPSIHEIETTCETRASFYGVSYWEKRNFKFEYAHGVVKLSTGKKLEIVELKNYLIRESASEKHTLVLEAVETYLPENRQKISIRFGNQSIFEEIYGNVRAAMQELFHLRLEVLLGDEVRQNQRFQEEVIKGLTFLTQRNINDYLDSKPGLLKKLKAKAAPTYIIYNRDGLLIRNSTLSSKYYFLDFTLPPTITSLEAAKDAINILGTRNIANRFYCEPLESFAQNIRAKYYKITTDNLECESVMIVETIQREGRLQRFMKAAESANLGVAVPFMAMELTMGKGNCYSFSLQGVIKIEKSANKKKQAVKLLLSMVSPAEAISPHNSIFSKSPPLEATLNHQTSPVRRKSYSDKSQFGDISINEPCSKAQRRDSSEGNDEEEFYSIQNEEMEGEVQNALNKYTSKNINIPTHDQADQCKEPQHLQMNYLKARAFAAPLKDCERRFIKENFLQQDWKRLSKGGVVCVNEDVINEQKKIFKLLCKQFGSKIFKMQAFSISLPVQICRPESALISIAKNVSYAPLLFEDHPSLTPLQRLKKVVILSISMAVLALSTQTPFNPVVGETYQGVIDGCPIFMEQISHHPAITYLLLEGRGYRVFGPIAPQICVRLNYVMGVNDTWLVVEFGESERVEFTIPTMIVNGMLFGDRNIYFESTNYVLDHQNGLLAELVFNVGNKGFFAKENPDLLRADIYQVTPAFLEAFQANKRGLSPKKDEKNKLLDSISGEWNGKLTLNNETIFDFETDLPLLLENCPHPLQSDSVYRPDSINLLKGAMERAQEEKERLEQRQRRDKKLREEYSKRKHK